MRDWLYAGFDRSPVYWADGRQQGLRPPHGFHAPLRGAPSYYPTSVELRTPIGQISLNLYSWHDARTIHEIFLVEDYHIGGSEKVIVDYGSNIGVSEAYFPFPQSNVLRLSV